MNSFENCSWCALITHEPQIFSILYTRNIDYTYTFQESCVTVWRLNSDIRKINIPLLLKINLEIRARFDWTAVVLYKSPSSIKVKFSLPLRIIIPCSEPYTSITTYCTYTAVYSTRRLWYWTSRVQLVQMLETAQNLRAKNGRTITEQFIRRSKSWHPHHSRRRSGPHPPAQIKYHKHWAPVSWVPPITASLLYYKANILTHTLTCTVPVEVKFERMVKLAVVFALLLAVLPTGAGQDTCALLGK